MGVRVPPPAPTISLDGFRRCLLFGFDALRLTYRPLLGFAELPLLKEGLNLIYIIQQRLCDTWAKGGELRNRQPSSLDRTEDCLDSWASPIELLEKPSGRIVFPVTLCAAEPHFDFQTELSQCAFGSIQFVVVVSIEFFRCARPSPQAANPNRQGETNPDSAEPMKPSAVHNALDALKKPPHLARWIFEPLILGAKRYHPSGSHRNNDERRANLCKIAHSRDFRPANTNRPRF